MFHHPAARPVLFTDCQNRDHNGNADERTGDPPQEGPEKHGKQHDKGRHRKNVAGYPRFKIASNQELDEVQTPEDE
jgi:hypothetical protein